MLIRKAKQSELNMLLNMTVNVISESSMGFVQTNYQNGLASFVPFINSGAYYLIALDHQTIAGWVLLGPDFNPYHMQKTGSIISLYVFPAYRKKGVGKQLMEHALNELKNQGFQKAQLNVYLGNPAKNLYEKMGFRDISSVMEITFN
ncbi:GNAT family N-acetyltransferase [Metabacillus sediminilitoris]|uniref:GNAT family N-acetyltransferase n=1 Tax=Metabacillus sediminilitoris TaxID=2567941 RepID=A0A4S4BS75_9BACI|nr:GNAT family N-acetyltransferase [Metabacillus sediminilitoris]QGQ48456.1 GNAT family N-acetyltransferase [Metabacillus sediminilitoris]THF77844.1 GNAT family N-acetyltransferase [Metabacillus sediminilitoris]